MKGRHSTKLSMLKGILLSKPELQPITRILPTLAVLSVRLIGEVSYLSSHRLRAHIVSSTVRAGLKSQTADNKKKDEALTSLAIAYQSAVGAVSNWMNERTAGAWRKLSSERKKYSKALGQYQAALGIPASQEVNIQELPDPFAFIVDLDPPKHCNIRVSGMPVPRRVPQFLAAPPSFGVYPVPSMILFPPDVLIRPSCFPSLRTPSSIPTYRKRLRSNGT